jgi:hypothetical protein
MRTEFKISQISTKYHAIRIHACPVEIIRFAAFAGCEYVSVENFTHFRNPDIASLTLQHGDYRISPHLSAFSLDFRISNPEFIALMGVWDRQGCYAVFHSAPALKFRASDLSSPARYHALDHFGWSLEIIMPDSASGDWTQCCSPDKSLIDRIAQRCAS